ncbi:MAG: TetR family transcriptional regulator, partial [Glaciihabitans sp.]
ATVARAPRRFDPERRDRIISATLDLIAEGGVAGVSHRKVAAKADVPLGSMTYHFENMGELLRESFERFATTVSDRFEEELAAATSPAEAQDAVVRLIYHGVLSESRELVLTLELYTLAARQPVYRQINRDWMSASRRALERHFDPDTARQLDALIEGLSIHLALAPEPHDRALTADAVARVCSHDVADPGKEKAPNQRGSGP